jgi:SH3 domain-containing YSC84-like protein 1
MAQEELISLCAVKSFIDHGNNGLDGVRSFSLCTVTAFLSARNLQVIPRTVLENAQGFAIFTVFKAGFLFSARAGSGIVVAKLPDGCTPLG